MIDYDRNAFLRNTLSFHGSVLPHVLGRVGLLTVLSLSLHFLQEFVLLPAGLSFPSLDPLGHTVLGMTMGLLIVFRTNSSNNRYWDARSHWGVLINCARNLTRMGATYAGPADDLAHLVVAYSYCIKQNLRGDRDLHEIQPLVSGRLYERACAAGNAPTVLAQAMSEWIERRLSEGRIGAQVAMRMEMVLITMVDAQGGAEKILQTPLPYVYAALIKQLLLLYLVSLPFVVVGKMGWAGPLVVSVVALAMFGIEEAGVEIENPFSRAPNELPLERLCATIARDAGLLSERHA